MWCHLASLCGWICRRAFSALIDANHTGDLFNVTLADVPERKQDFVMGRYELPAPPAGATVAVKVIDMLGEERVILLTP